MDRTQRWSPHAGLPPARGELSAWVLDALRGVVSATPSVGSGDPLDDDDLHLGLYLCYELHYRGLPGVSDRMEWAPELLGIRASLESAFESALLEAVPRGALASPGEVRDRLRAAADPGAQDPLTVYVERQATLEQARELLIHRSAYQLKEADPHSWVIPRLQGAAKTAVVEVQYDEYGSGDPTWMHSELFRATMAAAGLDQTYGAYVALLPGRTLATVNLISLFGLHRRWRGALLGHLAAFEMTSSIPNRHLANGFRRLGFEESATRFFDEHVEADAVHEILACDGAAALAAEEPPLAPDIVFGAEALDLLAARWSGMVLDAWRAGRSSLRVDQPALAR
jgi:Iron-containing redox enzyme